MFQVKTAKKVTKCILCRKTITKGNHILMVKKSYRMCLLCGIERMRKRIEYANKMLTESINVKRELEQYPKEMVIQKLTT